MYSRKDDLTTNKCSAKFIRCITSFSLVASKTTGVITTSPCSAVATQWVSLSVAAEARDFYPTGYVASERSAGGRELITHVTQASQDRSHGAGCHRCTDQGDEEKNELAKHLQVVENCQK